MPDETSPGIAPRPMTWRAPLMAVALVSMACGGWLGLVRLGWNLPLPWPDQLIAHGPLMVCGFLGTLISLERAVALGKRWAYAAPILVAAGAVALDLPTGALGPLFITGGSAVLLGIFAVLWRQRPALFMTTMALGAGAWMVGNLRWADGAAIVRVVWWWIAFLVLTIAGERLELNRVLRPSRTVRAGFIIATAVILGGAGVSVGWPGAGARVLGVGLIGLAAWLLRFDVARRTVRQRGLTRYMAVALLIGYVWLGFGGVVGIVAAVSTTGVVYDAMLHAVFLGFVMSMVFAHAPVIFPAVLGRPLAYRPAAYVHLGVLHASVLLRVIGDLVEDLGRWRAWGGMLNAVALLLFLVNTGWSIFAATRPRRAAEASAGPELNTTPSNRYSGGESWQPQNFLRPSKYVCSTSSATRTTRSSAGRS